MNGIQLGDYLQFIGASLSVAITFQAIVFGLHEFLVTTRRRGDVSRDPFFIPLKMVITRYYYAGLCALPWFVLSVFTCLFCPAIDLLFEATLIFVIVGWLILLVMVLDISLAGLRSTLADWIITHPDSLVARLLGFPGD